MSPYESIQELTAWDSDSNPVDEDLYCVFCGYNLRGLTGNPTRCPECGGFNDRSVIAVPAQFIRGELRKMETAPTTCVGVSVIASLLVLPLLFLGELIAPCLIIACAALLWLPPYFYMKKVFDNQHGWRSILLDFHLATACWVAGFFVPMSVLIPWGSAPRSPAIPPVIAGLCCLVAVGFFPLGMFIYRKGQKQIDILQRHKAVALVQRHFQRLNSTNPNSRLN